METFLFVLESSFIRDFNDFSLGSWPCSPIATVSGYKCIDKLEVILQQYLRYVCLVFSFSGLNMNVCFHFRYD